jgi:PadR family transcriptional regulator, regulatory protein PadR
VARQRHRRLSGAACLSGVDTIDRGFFMSMFDSVKRQRKVAPRSEKAANLELLSGFIRLHVLHHASKEPVVGFWMIEELGRHGYRLSTGTLYPLLHGLERRGYLRSALRRAGRRSWREYRATPAGRRALVAAKGKLRELFHELIR